MKVVLSSSSSSSSVASKMEHAKAPNPRRDVAFTSRALSRSKRPSTLLPTVTPTPSGLLFPLARSVLSKSSRLWTHCSLSIAVMRPTLVRLVRVVPRSKVDPALRPIPAPIRSDVVRPSLIELLQKRKEEAGADYPSNVRIEALEAKTALRGLPRDARKNLAAMLKEH